MTEKKWLNIFNDTIKAYKSCDESQKMAADHMLAMFWLMFLESYESAENYKNSSEAEQVECYKKFENIWDNIEAQHGKEAALGAQFFMMYIFGVGLFGDPVQELFDDTCSPMIERGLPLASI